MLWFAPDASSRIHGFALLHAHSRCADARLPNEIVRARYVPAALRIQIACSIQSCVHHSTEMPVVDATSEIFFKLLISVRDFAPPTE
jgi:hypothetical protein